MTSRIRRWLAVLPWLGLLWQAVPVAAMVYVAVDLPTLVADAGAVAVGRVAVVSPRWTEGRRAIETLVTVDVREYLKGDFGRDVTVAVPGGRIGPYLSVMPGAPRLAEGDEVVIFIAGGGSELPHLVALGQGVFRIVTDQASGARFVVPDLPSAASVAGTTMVRGDPARRPLPMDRFSAQVRALAAGQGR
jgi:hypothetical protein